MSYLAFFETHVQKFRVGPNGQASGLCPFHDDKTSSLSVDTNEGLWKCHRCDKSGNANQFANLLGVTLPPNGYDNEFQEINQYTYDDVNGRPHMQVRRYFPKTFRQFRFENGKWKTGLKGISPILYRLPEILNANVVFVVEGEKDVETLRKWELKATCNPMGAGKWRDEFSDVLSGKSVVILPDDDEPGRAHANSVAKSLWGRAKRIKIIPLPDAKDISEWVEKGGTFEQLMKLEGQTDWLKTPPVQEDEISRRRDNLDNKKPKKPSKPLTSQELIETLGLTIKKDEENKLITFLCALSAYTKNSQLNISFNAPSSTGKSYIPTEIARLFPEEDVVEVGYCSPTAFFHDVGEYNKEIKGYVVDLSRKILIFLDQPHTLLLQHLRPLLSHDKKEIRLKITDKSQRAGLKTKNIFLKGFPAVIFCTAGLKIDEQETTRFLLLSPETNQKKIREAIQEKIKKETNADLYERSLEENPKRKALKERIRAIKFENIQDIKISSADKLEQAFLSKGRKLKPRHQRDIGRVISLIKAFALLNLWFREKSGSTIVANENDINEALRVWDVISESQEHNLPPYIYQIFQEIIVPAWKDKNKGPSNNSDETIGQLGLTRREVSHKHLQVYGRVLADWLLRQQIIPMLESAGLITQEPDPNDRRKILIYPTMSLTISDENNSESGGGVDSAKAKVNAKGYFDPSEWAESQTREPGEEG